MMKYLLPAWLLVLFACTPPAPVDVTIEIDTKADRKPISPYVYGANQYTLDSNNDMNVVQNRFGGNRTTSYNWETNYSNAGHDYHYSNDWWLLHMFGLNFRKHLDIPGAIVQSFVDSARQADVLAMVTLQAAGYVAADSFRTVDCEAPCDRWVPVYPNKPGRDYVYPPDLTDNAVYVDEELNWLIGMYGKSDEGGIRFYQIDNEPDIWDQNQKFIKPRKITPSELADLNSTYAKMIKSFDPHAMVLGYVATSWWGLEGWIRGDAYLAEMKKRSDSAGYRLIDVFDVHFYPYDLVNLTGNEDWDRLQSPRILWDSTYYIPKDQGPMGYFASAPRLIKRWQSYIDQNYPGTKLGITEWSSATQSNRVIDGLVCADLIGVFGREDVFVANHFNDAQEYSAAAFKLYRNYDGQKSTYGDVNVQANSSDLAHVTSYASVEGDADGILHIILINKDSLQTLNSAFTINSDRHYKSGQVYYFDATSFEIKSGEAIKKIKNNTFTYALPKFSAMHMVLKAE